MKLTYVVTIALAFVSVSVVGSDGHQQSTTQQVSGASSQHSEPPKETTPTPPHNRTVSNDGHHPLGPQGNHSEPHFGSPSTSQSRYGASAVRDRSTFSTVTVPHYTLYGNGTWGDEHRPTGTAAGHTSEHRVIHSATGTCNPSSNTQRRLTTAYCTYTRTAHETGRATTAYTTSKLCRLSTGAPCANSGGSCTVFPDRGWALC